MSLRPPRSPVTQFWGVQISSSEPYEYEPDPDGDLMLQLTSVALASNKGVKKREAYFVTCAVDDDMPYTLCILRPGVVDQVQIDILFSAGNQKVTLGVKGGNAKIHITGYEVLEDSPDDNDMSDHDDEEDDTDKDEEGLLEDGEDEDGKDKDEEGLLEDGEDEDDEDEDEEGLLEDGEDEDDDDEDDEENESEDEEDMVGFGALEDDDDYEDDEDEDEEEKPTGALAYFDFDGGDDDDEDEEEETAPPPPKKQKTPSKSPNVKSTAGKTPFSKDPKPQFGLGGPKSTSSRKGKK